jgi:putative hydrolase of the HAD superfamily
VEKAQATRCLYMERPELVLVDFDDTLVDTGSRFQAAREALADLLGEAGFDREDVLETHHHEVEPELLAILGLGPHRLEASFRDTYVRLCVHKREKPDPAFAHRCALLGRQVEGCPNPLPGALEALAELAELTLVGVFSQAANQEQQLECIRRAGVLRIVGSDRVHVTPRKTAETFREAVLALGGSDPALCWMIGNSMASDVNPALLAGARAILLEREHVWVHDLAEPVSDRFWSVNSFPEAVDRLRDFFLPGRPHGNRALLP